MSIYRESYKSSITMPLFSLLLLPLQAGCTTLYDPLPPSQLILSEEELIKLRQVGHFTGLTTEEGKALRDAIIHVEARREQVAKRRHEQVVGSGRIGSAVLLGTAATTASAVFGAPRDLIAGLALGTAGTQATRSLYFERGYDRSYLSADRALGCTARAARLSLDAHVRAEIAHVRLNPLYEEIDGLRQDSAVPTSDAEAAAAALSQIQADGGKVTSVREGTGSLSRKLPVLSETIMDQLSQQLADQMPDAQAFNAAVQTIGDFTLPSAAKSPAPSTGGPVATSSGDPQENLRLLRVAIASAHALSDDIEAARSDFTTKSSDLLKSCGFAAAAAPTPLSILGIEGNSVSIKTGEAISLQIQGGSGNYFSSVVGKRPGGVDLSLLGASIEINADGQTAKPGNFSLLIRDAVAKVPSLSIAVVITN
jgi:hypothetical protein